ncbi:MAG: metallophosphoesterase, partial [Candidatus Kapaibacteriota bacterium]
FVIDLWQKNKAIAIRGNHEEMLLNSLSDPTALINWEYNGSRATLESFKVSHPKDIPQDYVFFFESMPFYVELENYILVHGDLDFDAENPFQNTQYLVWGRSRRADPNKTKMRKVVVGHTPTPLNEIIISLNQWKIFLDGGCVYARSIFKQNLGYLCALDLNSNELYYTYCIDF